MRVAIAEGDASSERASAVEARVRGAYDPQRDGRALRDVEVRRAIAQALAVRLEPGEDPGLIAYDDPHRQRALEKFLSARAGGDAMDRFAVEYTKTTGKEARRVNPCSPCSGAARAIEPSTRRCSNGCCRSSRCPDTVIADLAAQRARAIANFIAQVGIDPRRIAVGKAQVVEDRSKPVAARLALEAA